MSTPSDDPSQHLPVEATLPDLTAALRADRRAVLHAPPGAGKTTRVPLALLQSGLVRDEGRIVMLEPRRLAARAAAERMAEILGERVGETVGYRMRGDTRVGRRTRIEVVTEGVLTRMIQSDPELGGVACVIFDEFHERSLNADLGLALTLDIAGALREDLMVLVMSATLDTAPVAGLLGARIVSAEGRAHPVEIRWADRPQGARRLEAVMADAILEALESESGGILAFLPGEGEIRRTAARLTGRLPENVVLRPLYGALPFAEQRRAILPEREGRRKVVLSTSIAETSLTIEDVRVVIDSGLARRARLDPGSGMTRLVTEKASRAETDQRAGRAGRTAPGVAWRLWTRAEHGARPVFPPAEIEVADLAGLALDLALWGAEPEALPFLTQPAPGALAAARGLLTDLGALDAKGRITSHGRQLAEKALHPRLAHMLVAGGKAAAPLAALLSDRDPLRDAPVDLSLRLELLNDPAAFAARRPFAFDRAAVSRIRAEARRLERDAEEGPPLSPAQLAALAYPDRIGRRRTGEAPRYLLSGGRGARLSEADPLAHEAFLVVAETDGARTEALIRQAIAITEAEIRAVLGERVEIDEVCEWSRREGRVIARRLERLGAIVLAERPWHDVPAGLAGRAMLEGVRQLGLPWSDRARRLAARVNFLGRCHSGLPDMSETALLDSAETWLLPHLGNVRDAEGWRGFDIHDALAAMLDWQAQETLRRLAPEHFVTPLGRRVPIDYASDPPEIRLKLQEMFGQAEHPRVAGQALKVTLLSPAGRPLQSTTDLPGFWRGSYAEVRKEMRGRYPRHPWPEDPLAAVPTLRAKPRNS